LLRASLNEGGWAGSKSIRDVKATDAMRLIFTKTYRHFATNDAIGFTFKLQAVKIKK
jgi:hypothetical protein